MAQRAKAQAGSAKRNRPSKQKPAAQAPAPKPRPQEEGLVFALDIGTRTVIGVVGERLEGNGFRVLDYELMEHPGRAMMDGQVEDIAQVGRLAAEVKRRLEGRLGVSLRRVCLAAAGRMLRTVRVRAGRELPAPHTVADRDMVVGLEGEAIEMAQEQAREAEGQARQDNYYCVGYSIVEYRMDGQPVSQLIGHTCSEISVELIAAFLPYSVVEGLYAAVDMCGLEVTSLTLEPIAAINVLIPRELRLLNLALVDIGAGTSDIAICRDGRVTSYDMATIAGDELTEAVIQQFLVDFATAEHLKRSLVQGGEALAYENILGAARTVQAESLLEAMQEAVSQLAQTVAEKILACNGGPPAAVFLIGGGSQVPGLGKALAACLGVPADNVAVGPRRSLKGVDASAFPALTGPEFVTPLGIAVTAITQECFHFFGVSVNGRRLKLLNTSHMRLMDVLLMAGYRAGQIIARSGRSLAFTLNGGQKILRGGLPEHAAVTINGAPASIDADVRPGDVILITPAREGAPATATVADFLPAEGCVSIRINGRPAGPDDPISNGDAVEVLPAPPAGEAPQGESPQGDEPGQEWGGPGQGLEPKRQPPVPEPAPEPMAASEAPVLTPPAATGPEPQPAAATGPDAVPAPPLPPKAAPVTDVAPTPTEQGQAAPISDEEGRAAPINAAEAAPAAVPDPPAQPAPEPAARVESPAATLGIVLNGQALALPIDSRRPVYFMMHLLERAGVDPAHPQGQLLLECDGEPVGFMHRLKNGAQVRIGWK